MRKSRTVLFAVAFGVAALLAGCQSMPDTSAYGGIFPANIAPTSVTFEWSHAGPIDVIGIGTGSRYDSTNPGELVIDNLDSVDFIRVQAAVKFGYKAEQEFGGTRVDFLDSADNLLASVDWADSSHAVSGDFFEAFVDPGDLQPDGIIRAEVVNGPVIAYPGAGDVFHTPRSFLAFVMRDDTSPSVTSKALNSYADVWWNNSSGAGFVPNVTEILSFDSALVDRPVSIGFAISELDTEEEGDEQRVIDVTVLVGGVEVYSERLGPDKPNNAGDELYLGEVLTVLPAGAEDVVIEVVSPDVNGDSVWLAGFNASVEEPGVFEGCTPGYWRNHSADPPGNQANAWLATDYRGDDLFSSVFAREITVRVGGKGRPVDVIDPELLEAVVAAGGGVNALARHAVAAVLNASHPDVNAYYTVDEVVQMVQDALDEELDLEEVKDMLDAANNLGCPL